MAQHAAPGEHGLAGLVFSVVEDNVVRGTATKEGRMRDARSCVLGFPPVDATLQRRRLAGDPR